MSHIRIKKDVSDYSFYNKRGLIETQHLYDENGTIIVYDVFIRDKKLYFISTFISETVPQFRIKVEGHSLIEFGLNEPEPVRYFFCMIKDNATEFNIFINGNISLLKPAIVIPLKHKHALGIATLFKFESGPNIQRFLDYYRMQGVTAFYLYYNGAELPDDLPNDIDVFYRVWNFPYWNTNKTYMHGAQSIFLTTVRHRHLDDCMWLALVDLDEFIYGSCPLVHYLRSLPLLYDVVRIQNYWSRCPDGGGPITYCSEGGDWLNRTKCIYRRGFKGQFSIHGPKPVGDFKEFRAADLKLLHVVNEIHNDRLELIKAPTLETECVLGSILK